MKNWMLVSVFAFGVAVIGTSGCGSPQNTVTPAPPEMIDSQPDVDESTAEYQKSMSGG